MLNDSPAILKGPSVSLVKGGGENLPARFCQDPLRIDRGQRFGLFVVYIGLLKVKHILTVDMLLFIISVRTPRTLCDSTIKALVINIKGES